MEAGAHSPARRAERLQRGGVGRWRPGPRRGGSSGPGRRKSGHDRDAEPEVGGPGTAPDRRRSGGDRAGGPPEDGGKSPGPDDGYDSVRSAAAVAAAPMAWPISVTRAGGTAASTEATRRAWSLTRATCMLAMLRPASPSI